MTPTLATILVTALTSAILLALAAWGAHAHRRVEQHIAVTLRAARGEIEALGPAAHGDRGGDGSVQGVLARVLAETPAILEAWSCFHATLVGVAGRPRRAGSVAEFLDLDLLLAAHAGTRRGLPPRIVLTSLPRLLVWLGCAGLLASFGLALGTADWGSLLQSEHAVAALLGTLRPLWLAPAPLVLGLVLAAWSHSRQQYWLDNARIELQLFCHTLDARYRHVSQEELLARILQAVEAHRARVVA